MDGDGRGSVEQRLEAHDRLSAVAAFGSNRTRLEQTPNVNIINIRAGQSAAAAGGDAPLSWGFHAPEGRDCDFGQSSPTRKRPHQRKNFARRHIERPECRSILEVV
jgi:hypothetical protein